MHYNTSGFRIFMSFLVAGFVLFLGGASWAANPANGLRVEVLAAPNFVVDSNVQTPASYGPRAAYLSAVFHNDGTNDITDAFAFIGDYKGGVGATPGVYPSTNWTGLTGTFSLTHEGGSAGTADATRYLGTIKPGESVTVYWLVSYPLKDSSGKAVFGSGPDPILAGLRARYNHTC